VKFGFVYFMGWGGWWGGLKWLFFGFGCVGFYCGGVGYWGGFLMAVVVGLFCIGSFAWDCVFCFYLLVF